MTWPVNNPGYPGTISGGGGTPGPQGPEGEAGAAATIAVGAVAAVPNGTPPTVTNSGTAAAAILDFELETGATGAAGSNGTNGLDGADGIDGAEGTNGVGVPIGGSTGEVLKKHSNGDYDTEWGVAASGGHTIQDETTPMTARANLNFTGAGVTVTDDAGNDRTVVTIPGGGGSGGGSFLVMQVFS